MVFKWFMLALCIMHYEQMQLSGTCSSFLGLICNFLIHFLELQHIFNLGLHQQQQRKKQSTGYRRAIDWSFKNGMTLLPSLIKKKTILSNVMQKAHIILSKNVTLWPKKWTLYAIIKYGGYIAQFWIWGGNMQNTE